MSAKDGKRIVPSGIESFDDATNGGFPSGSVAEVIGETGAGHYEFVTSVCMMLSLAKKGKIEIQETEGVMIPDEIHWITLTHSPAGIKREIELTYDAELWRPFESKVNFKDFSESYFTTSSVPVDWVTQTDRGEKEGAETGLESLEEAVKETGEVSGKPRHILTSLADFLSNEADGNLVVLHTLTDLGRLYSDSEELWHEFITHLRAIQRKAKQWDSLFLFILDADVLPSRMENEISTCADVVISFEWFQSGPSDRRRILSLKKFRGHLPEEGGGSRFEIKTTASSGMQMMGSELISSL